MKNNAMKNIHNMNQRALNSYAEHQLNSLKSQFGTGQGTTNKKPQQPTNTSNKKTSSLWDELNEGKSKQESGNFESSNVTYIKNPPVVNQQPVQPQNQNLQLQQALQKIQELEQALNNTTNQLNQVREENLNLKDNLTIKDNKIEEVSNKNIELQGKLLEKTEQVHTEHSKYVDVQHKLEIQKLKLSTFIEHHQDIEDQQLLVEMLGDLQISNN